MSKRSEAVTAMLALAIVGGFFLDFTAQLAFAQPAPPPLNLTGSAPITVTPSGAGNLARVIACPTCGASSGNVTGPNSSVTGDLAVYADATGKVLADGGTVFPLPASGSTQSVARVTVSGANGGLALVPNGNGALMLRVPDATATGGNARGTQAIDLQVGRTAANQVASGLGAFAGGLSNISNGNESVALGNGNTADGTLGSIAMGQGNISTSNAVSIAMGRSNSVTGGSYSIALGQTGVLTGNYSSVIGGCGTDRGNSGVHAWTSADSSQSSCAAFMLGQDETYVIQASAGSTTAVTLTTDQTNGSASTVNLANLANFTSYAFGLNCVARDMTTPATLTWTLQGMLSRDANAASTSIGTTGAPVAGPTTATPPTASLTAGADTTNGGLSVQFTPPAANTHTWHAVCTVHATWVR